MKALALLFFSLTAFAKPEVSPYFYTWGLGNPVYKITSLTDAKTKAGLNNATLAFVISTGSCQVSQGVDDMLADIKNFKAAGGKLTLSFGGANGPYLEDSCKTDDTLFAQIDGLISRTGIYNLDFDVEGYYLALPEMNDRRTRVLKRLKAKYPQIIISYTLPVMTPRSEWDKGGLTNDGINFIKRTIALGLNIEAINIMAMDYYFTLPGKTHGDLAIAAAEQVISQLKILYPTKNNLYSMLGITPMIGKQDDGSIFTQADALQLTQYATAKGVRLLSMWAFQRDQIGTGDLGVYSQINKANFEFYKIMTGGTVVSPTPSLSPSPKPSLSPSPSPSVTPPPSTSCGEVWSEGKSYKKGQMVSYQGKIYTALVDHTAYVGANWNPADSLTLWTLTGTCLPNPVPSPTPSCLLWSK